jgi:hypothetical protein
MTDTVEVTGSSAGIERRDFLRRSAIVGGMVWAAPVIQSIGSPAFAFTPSGREISNVSFLVLNQGSGKWKYEATGSAVNAKLDGSPTGCAALYEQVKSTIVPGSGDNDGPDKTVEQLWNEAPSGNPPSVPLIDRTDPTKWCLDAVEAGYYIAFAFVKGGAGSGDNDSSCTFLINTNKSDPWCVSTAQ